MSRPKSPVYLKRHWPCSRSKRRLKQAAFHEAGHAVARAVVGAPLTRTEIDETGGGLTHGTLAPWQSSAAGQYAAWDFIVVRLAGPLSEARISKRAKTDVMLSYGHDDCRQAEDAIAWLVARGFVDSTNGAWCRAEGDTRSLLTEHWPKIERVANALLLNGVLETDELCTLVSEGYRHSGEQPS